LKSLAKAVDGESPANGVVNGQKRDFYLFYQYVIRAVSGLARRRGRYAPG
jgi:hypothetical protein